MGRIKMIIQEKEIKDKDENKIEIKMNKMEDYEIDSFDKFKHFIQDFIRKWDFKLFIQENFFYIFIIFILLIFIFSRFY